MAKHTPGPWKVDDWDHYNWTVRVNDKADKVGICQIERDEGEAWADEIKANARLIAAAPQLLEALREVDNFFDWGGFDIDFSNGNICNGVDEGDVLGAKMMLSLTEQIKAAIAAATGADDA